MFATTAAAAATDTDAYTDANDDDATETEILVFRTERVSQFRITFAFFRVFPVVFFVVLFRIFAGSLKN